MTKPGYQHLLSYQQLEEIYDLTNQFCQGFLPRRENLRIREQMIHAARSAKQCLVEGYEQESLKGYIKLTGVSRGSLKELLEDYKDFARNHQVEVWDKGDKRVKQMLAQRKQRKQGPKWSLPLTPFNPLNPLYPVNYLLNLVNMTTYLLDRQINSLKEKFVKEGGRTERMFCQRLIYRKKQTGFTLTELLIALAIIIITLAGGVVGLPAVRQVWERKVSPTPTPTPTPVWTQSCTTDNDCPKQFCQPPGKPCPQYYCIQGKCQLVEPSIEEQEEIIGSLNGKIKLTPGQTVNIADTNLSLTLLKITTPSPNCFDCPTTAGVEVKSGRNSEKISFIVGVLATKEVEAKLRQKEIFGFRIAREELRPEFIILTVQKL